MIVELYEKEYQYIIKCFKELLPQYSSIIEKTLSIDNCIKELNLRKEAIYSFDLDLDDKDIEIIVKMRNKLKKHKSLEEFETYDKYMEFFFFIEEYCKKRNCK